MEELAPSDKALVGRLLAGEEMAFEEFFEGYFPRLYRFALARLGGDADGAEEVVQSTLCRAMTKLATYRGEASLFTWLCTFCRHELAGHYKRNGRLQRGPLVPLVEDAPELRAALESLESGYDPEQILARKETARLVQVVLDSLPPRYGNVLEWKYIQGHSVGEIAERLNVGPKAAESLLTRARQAFREGFAALGAGLAES